MRTPASDPTERREDGPADEFACPCCGKSAPVVGSQVCATCKRRICPACIRPYGHHMMVCEDCRLAEW